MEYKIFKEFYVKTKLLTFFHKPFSYMTEQSLVGLFCAPPVATHMFSYVAAMKGNKNFFAWNRGVEYNTLWKCFMK